MRSNFTRPSPGSCMVVVCILLVVLVVIYYSYQIVQAVNEKHDQAWRAINQAQERQGSGGNPDPFEEARQYHVPLSLTEGKGAIVCPPGADVRKANLSGADLRQANFSGADLQEANLRGADLRGANLQKSNLRKANLQKAFLLRTNFQGANLQNADLRGAEILKANCQGADFRGADLKNADLWGSDLRWAKMLTVEQLSTVKTLHNTLLDPKIAEQIKKNYPHLFEKPKDTEK